jgi:hypothetical protein
MSIVWKLMLAGILAAYAALSWHANQPVERNTEAAVVDILPMTFAHKDHIIQRCVDCHHNFEDDSGQGLCIDCHVRDDDLAYRIEKQFHDLCRGCHLDEHRKGEKAGPLRRCDDCHTADHLP